MQTQTKRHQIALHNDVYNDLRAMGRYGDSMFSVVSRLLKNACTEKRRILDLEDHN